MIPKIRIQTSYLLENRCQYLPRHKQVGEGGGGFTWITKAEEKQYEYRDWVSW